MTTANELANSHDFNADSSPRYECIIGQKYIGDIWVFANEEHTIFSATICRQSTDKIEDQTWDEIGPAWLEDGVARKGLTIRSEAFFDYKEAKRWLDEQTEELMIEIYGGLSQKEMTP